MNEFYSEKLYKHFDINTFSEKFHIEEESDKECKGKKSPYENLLASFSLLEKNCPSNSLLSLQELKNRIKDWRLASKKKEFSETEARWWAMRLNALMIYLLSMIEIEHKIKEEQEND